MEKRYEKEKSISHTPKKWNPQALRIKHYLSKGPKKTFKRRDNEFYSLGEVESTNFR